MEDILKLAEEHAKELKLTPEEYIKRAVEEKIKLGTKTSFPEDFTITSGMQQWFEDQGFKFDIREATDDWAHSMINNKKKYRYSNWESAWRNGMKKHKTWRDKGGRIERGKTAYEEFAERPRTAIEKAIRLRQGRASSIGSRGHCGGRGQTLGQNGGYQGKGLDNSMGRH